jgi:hypothetical protein
LRLTRGFLCKVRFLEKLELDGDQEEAQPVIETSKWGMPTNIFDGFKIVVSKRSGFIPTH